MNASGIPVITWPLLRTAIDQWWHSTGRTTIPADLDHHAPDRRLDLTRRDPVVDQQMAHVPAADDGSTGPPRDHRGIPQVIERCMGHEDHVRRLDFLVGDRRKLVSTEERVHENPVLVAVDLKSGGTEEPECCAHEGVDGSWVCSHQYAGPTIIQVTLRSAC